MSILNKLEEKPRHLFYLSVFRIFISIHLLKKLTFHWPSYDILFGSNSFLRISEDQVLSFFIDPVLLRSNYEFLVIAFYIILLLNLFGVGKHLTAISVYLFLEIFQRLNGITLNGGDNLLKFLVLYMAMANSYEYFSYSSVNNYGLSNFFTNISVICIMIHLCLVYFVSGMSKAHSDVWYNGVALYYIFHLERFQGTSFNEVIAKNGLIVTIATYFTLLFELYFPVLIWIKKLRITLLVCGVLLHLGIYVFMMIYDFQMVFIFTYGFFFSDQEYAKLLHKLSSKISFLKPLIPQQLIALV